MKKSNFNKSRSSIRLVAITTIACMAMPLGAFGANPLPLSQIPNPVFGTTGGTVPATVPAHLQEYIKSNAAAVKLGKALFWDMQVGSDGIQACASCHYKAGADPLNVRAKNQLNPGPNGFFDVSPVNDTLLAADFPFFQLIPVRNFDDVTGSQGVFKTAFNAIVLGSAVDTGTPVTDTVFNVGGSNVRQVTGRNTPPAVNAVFNFDNFWDGRGKNAFNGSSPIGHLDTTAGVWLDTAGTLVKTPIAIPNSSLASQAVGPGLSDVEMSYAGRTWPDVGKKMLSLAPLAQQFVHPQDSVLGTFSKATLNGTTLNGAKGINGTYAQMIKDAFQDKYWNSAAFTTDGHNQMEANFSLFWGLAIQHYEATLVSDQTPFDQFLAGTTTAMSQAAKNGFGTFQSQCAVCHSGSELSNATVSEAQTVGNLIELNATGVANAISDVGFSNIGIRPTADDSGRGGVINFPLSFAGEAKASLPFAPFLLPAGATTTSPLAVNGTFKVPSIRNIELTAPYFHNGSAATLAELVEVYARGGNFANPEMSDRMKPFGPLGNLTTRNEMVAFLTALTDERVRNDAAPFDHPELFVPNGDPSPSPLIQLLATNAAGIATPGTVTVVTVVPATGATLTPALASPQTTGTAVTLTAAATGGDAGPYEYRFFWRPSGVTTFTQGRAYSTTPTWTWDTTGLPAGAYVVRVNTRHVGSTLSFESNISINFGLKAPATVPVPATGATLTPGVASPQTTGTAITLTAAATGGDAGPYEYRFFWRPSGTTTYTQGRAYSTAPTWAWNTAALGLPAGSYVVRVNTRHVGSAVSFETNKSINFKLQ